MREYSRIFRLFYGRLMKRKDPSCMTIDRTQLSLLIDDGWALAVYRIFCQHYDLRASGNLVCSCNIPEVNELWLEFVHSHDHLCMKGLNFEVVFAVLFIFIWSSTSKVVQ